MSNNNQTVYSGTGHRKTSIARVRLVPGSGKSIINGVNGECTIPVHLTTPGVRT